MSRAFLIGFAATALGFASSAWATIVDVNIKGSVGFGTDAAGVFGTPGASLVGDQFSVAYVFDTAHASASSTSTNVFGGSFYGSPSPVVSSAITINNITVYLPGDGLGQMQGLNIGYDTLDYVSEGTSGDLNVDIVGPTTSVTTAFNVALSGFNNNGFFEYGSIRANLIATAANVDIGGTPLPSTWVLLLSGLFVLGLVVRRRVGKEVTAVCGTYSHIIDCAKIAKLRLC